MKLGCSVIPAWPESSQEACPYIPSSRTVRWKGMGRCSQTENAKAENRLKTQANLTDKFWVSLNCYPIQKLAHTWVLLPPQRGTCMKKSMVRSSYWPVQWLQTAALTPCSHGRGHAVGLWGWAKIHWVLEEGHATILPIVCSKHIFLELLSWLRG